MPLGNDPSHTPFSREPANREREVGELKGEIERLLLISEALWNIVRSKCDLPEDELAREIHRLDLEDGVADLRKRATPPRPCPKCGRVVTKKKAACTFCGTPLPIVPFER